MFKKVVLIQCRCYGERVFIYDNTGNNTGSLVVARKICIHFLEKITFDNRLDSSVTGNKAISDSSTIQSCNSIQVPTPNDIK